MMASAESGGDEAQGHFHAGCHYENCVVYHAHGGFVVGSEMSGGVKNMFVSNCTFIGTDIGLRLKQQGVAAVWLKIFV
jgi:DNA sulfur modification protein DndE